MIYILAVLAGALLGFAWWMWRPSPRPAVFAEPEVEDAVEELMPPPPIWQDPFNFAHFNETRRKYADDIDTEAQRLVGKLESVREALNDDMAALRRMRAEADAAKAEAAEMRQAKADAEATLESNRSELLATIEARQLAAQRIDQLNEMLGARDSEIARGREETAKLEAEYKATAEAAALSDEALARNGLLLHESNLTVTRLEQLVLERDEELAVRGSEIEALRAETAARREQIASLELKVANMVERFGDARNESLAIIGKLREGQEQANGRAEKLAADGETMRRHIVETERARDKLLGQVGQLRAENAGLRAESQVKLRDLETLNNELTANIAVLERMLTNARTVRAQPAPARAQLRLIAEAKKVPGRALGG
jgi:chromosome segregation ATPase